MVPQLALDESTRIIRLIQAILSSTAAIANAVLLWGILRARLFRTTNERAALIPTLGVGLLSFTIAISYFISLANGGFEGPVGEANCQYQGVVTTAFFGLAFGGHLLLALERYTRIVKNRELTKRHMMAWLAFISVLLICECAISFGHFRLMANGTYCLYAFVDPAPTLRIPAIICIVYSLGILGGINFCYSMIYLRARSLFSGSGKDSKGSNGKDGNSNLSPSMRDPELQTYNTHDTGVTGAREQRSLLFRCLAVLIVFMTFYTPSFLLFLYELVSGAYAPRIIHWIATIMASVDCNVSPLLFIYLNRDYRDAIKRYVFLRR